MPKVEIKTHLATEATVGSGDFAYELVNGPGFKDRHHDEHATCPVERPDKGFGAGHALSGSYTVAIPSNRHGASD
jgi:hypothetical protein